MLEQDWIGTESDGVVGARVAIRDHEEATEHVCMCLAVSYIDADPLTQSIHASREKQQL